ncbi:MAG: hypothetical protein ACFFCE_18800 [Promethearchaeota archaeon]
MNSKSNRKKILSFLIVSFLLILGIFNVPFIYAIHMEGDGATFIPDDDHPVQYGVFLPEPNMYGTISIEASNQGRFAMLNWKGVEKDHELVDFPGEDISDVYPWYFDKYYKDTSTSNDFIDPWMIDWINITTLNPHNITLSNYTINTVFNYQVLIEGNSLIAQLNHSIPFQIDVMIQSTGPKVLKMDWLTDDPSKISQWMSLISPSGKEVDYYDETATSHAVTPSVDVFDYITFVAHETGAYRLLVYAKHDEGKAAFLNLEFLSSSISSLPLESLEFCGNNEDILAIEEAEHSTWQSMWYRIKGEEGDIIRVDLTEDYTTGVEPIISIWNPGENGYVLDTPLGAGTYEIYFPIKENAYISFVDADYGDWYRYSLYSRKYESIGYNIGDNLTTVRLSRFESKVLEFSIEDDSFVRFNFTSKQAGNPQLNTLGTENATIFMDSKKQDGYKVLSPIKSIIANNEWFHYYYMPSGTYKAIIKNSDEANEGVFEISSKYVDYLNDTMPITSLTYPDIYPSQFLTIGFDPDDYYAGIHKAQCAYINITEPGQYFINATIYASDNAGAATANPSAVVYYNGTESIYYDNTSAAITPGQTFPVFDSTNDYLYIAFDRKFGGFTFDFSQGGDAGGDIYPFLEVWDGSNFNNYVTTDSDSTNHFQQDGLWSFDILDPDFVAWPKGTTQFDLPDIEEDMYYWARFDCWSSAFTTLPTIDLITLSNITLEGDINLVLVGDSEYEYCDFYTPWIDSDLSDLEINPGGIFNDSDAGGIFSDTAPGIIGLEEGLYKLFIIPHGWDYQGQIQIDFGIGNFYSYRHEQTYNITEEPNLYPYQIRSYNASWYGPNNITKFSYGLTTSYNDTESSIYGGVGPSYFVLECYGDAYMWTQLVVSTNNVTDYTLYLMQDLPWVNNSGPNREVATIVSTSIPDVNMTHEFGVHTDHFYLIFEVTSPGDWVTFRIDLTQYNTTILTTSVPTGSYKKPSPGLSGLLFWGLVIGVPVAAGVIVLIYVLKKKGRIGTKTP